jgi:hypothetical protein
MAQDAKAAALAKARLLINLATNHAASPDEARNAAVLACKLLEEHGLLDRSAAEQPPMAPPPAPQPSSSQAPSDGQAPKARPQQRGPQRYVPSPLWAGRPPTYSNPRAPRAIWDAPPAPRKPPPKPPPPKEPVTEHHDAWTFDPMGDYYQVGEDYRVPNTGQQPPAPSAPFHNPYNDFFSRVASSNQVRSRSIPVNRPARGSRMSAPLNDICRKCGGDVYAGSSIVWVTNWGPVHLRCADR